MPEFPRCAMCRVTIVPGQNVVFRVDGRVAHVECPEVVCPVCTRSILPGDPIRRYGAELLHGNCWMSRQRVIAGGVAALDWNLFARSPLHWRETYAERRAALQRTWEESRALRRFAQVACRRRAEAV